MSDQGSLKNRPHAGQSTDVAGWSRYSDEDRLFELLLPPGTQLSLDETAAPGEVYLYWSPAPGMGTFSIHLQPSPDRTAQAFLDLEKEFGRITKIEVNEAVIHNGYPAHHLRFLLHQKFAREVVKDPHTGEIRHMPEREIHELLDFLFFTGEKHAARVGYRLNLEAPLEFHADFRIITQNFRLLRHID